MQKYSINRLIAVPSLMKTVLPVLQSPKYKIVLHSLKLLILSGELLSLSLCLKLLKMLPTTVILNLYGSTEVSGDCTYFDCERLPMILRNNSLESVPIGLPIANCNVELVGGSSPNQGEICVHGLCLGAGYFDHPFILPFGMEVAEDARVDYPASNYRLTHCFKTGDVAKQLQSGDLVFLGREDRIIKMNGQRVSLDEIENVLREHPCIRDAAVVCKRIDQETSHVVAHLVLNQKEDCSKTFKSLLKRWIDDKLPQAMIPSHFFFTESLPISSSGKVDYNCLASSSLSTSHEGNENRELQDRDLLKKIAEAFQESLMVEKVTIHDNFFEMGGNSLSAAYVSHKLNINMKLMYSYPTVSKLQMAIQREIRASNNNLKIDANLRADVGAANGSFLPGDCITDGDHKHNPCRRFRESLDYITSGSPVKILKRDPSLFNDSKDDSLGNKNLWAADALHTACSFSRCNRVVHAGKREKSLPAKSLKVPVKGGGSLEELWKVHMESCVDASPLVVFMESDAYIFIGAHSQKFVCIDAKRGFVLWEVKLEGRIECSAAVLDDFSQVVVGCYQGNIYFLNILDGSIRWKFKTSGEVKSQPVEDKPRHLVWCGSYDHHIYALDYKNYSCTFRFSCGGSIFGSPAVDEVYEKLFVASTSGLLTAISVKALPFRKLWMQDLQVPVFGSLSINPSNRNVICCLVNGSVVALDTDGSIIWKSNTGGPLFAGPSISDSLPFQVLVCSRDGSIYSFELEKGNLLWHHVVGCPVTSSAYVDDNMTLSTDCCNLSERLVCVCTSNGSVRLLRVMSDILEGTSLCEKVKVQEYARLDLKGDIFSSPVMIGGKIFVGCRDDYVYCIGMCPVYQ